MSPSSDGSVPRRNTGDAASGTGRSRMAPPVKRSPSHRSVQLPGGRYTGDSARPGSDPRERPAASRPACTRSGEVPVPDRSGQSKHRARINGMRCSTDRRASTARYGSIRVAQLRERPVHGDRPGVARTLGDVPRRPVARRRSLMVVLRVVLHDRAEGRHRLRPEGRALRRDLAREPGQVPAPEETPEEEHTRRARGEPCGDRGTERLPRRTLVPRPVRRHASGPRLKPARLNVTPSRPTSRSS